MPIPLVTPCRGMRVRVLGVHANRKLSPVRLGSRPCRYSDRRHVVPPVRAAGVSSCVKGLCGWIFRNVPRIDRSVQVDYAKACTFHRFSSLAFPISRLSMREIR